MHGNRIFLSLSQIIFMEEVVWNFEESFSVSWLGRIKLD